MVVLKAQEQIEQVAVLALAFGGLSEDTRRNLLSQLYEQAETGSRSQGRVLSQMKDQEVDAIFARFGWVVERK